MSLENTKITEQTGKSYTVNSDADSTDLVASIQANWDHAQEIRQQCLELEEIVSRLESVKTHRQYFPIISAR